MTNITTKLCHNCGIPSDTFQSAGITLKIEHKAETNYHRDSKRTVWCCSEECAIQALAIAKYGPSTHRWPVTLAQFRSTCPLKGHDRTETIAKTRINTGAEKPLCEKLDPEYGQGVSVLSEGLPRHGGRPRKWASEAARLKAYRQSENFKKAAVA